MARKSVFHHDQDALMNYKDFYSNRELSVRSHPRPKSTLRTQSLDPITIEHLRDFLPIDILYHREFTCLEQFTDSFVVLLPVAGLTLFFFWLEVGKEVKSISLYDEAGARWEL